MVNEPVSSEKLGCIRERKAQIQLFILVVIIVAHY